MANKIDIKIGSDIRGFKKGVASVKSRLKKLVGSGMGKVAGGIGIAAVVSKTISVISSGISSTRRFQKQMSEINTLARLSAGGLKALKKEVSDLSVELGVTTDTLTGGLYQALSAGVPQNNAIDFLRLATKASIAGVTDVETAVDGITSVLNAYKMEADQAEKVSDTFFTTIRLGKTTFSELSESIGAILPVAKASGVSFEEVGASIATMTKQGLSTREAGTALRGIFKELIAPGDKLAKVISEIEKTQDGAAFSSFSFQKKLKYLSNAVGGNKEQLKQLFPEIRAFTGVLQLTGDNARGAASDLKEVTSEIGSMDKAFSEFADTADTKMNKVEQRWEILKKKLGEAVIVSIVVVYDEITRFMKGTKRETAQANVDSFKSEQKLLHFKMQNGKSSEERRQAQQDFNYLGEHGIVKYTKMQDVRRAKSREAREKPQREAEAEAKRKKDAEAAGKAAKERAEQRKKDKADKKTETQEKKYRSVFEDIKHKIAMQKLINDGKEKEARIEEKIFNIKKRGLAITPELREKIKKLDDLEHTKDKNKSDIDSPQAVASVRSDRLARIGGTIGNARSVINQADVKRNTLLEKIAKNTEQNSSATINGVSVYS